MFPPGPPQLPRQTESQGSAMFWDLNIDPGLGSLRNSSHYGQIILSEGQGRLGSALPSQKQHCSSQDGQHRKQLRQGTPSS